MVFYNGKKTRSVLIAVPDKRKKEDILSAKERIRVGIRNDPVLLSLYHSNKLGCYPVSLDRLRAGFMLMKDYSYSFFRSKMTFNYDGMFGIRGGYGAGEILLTRQEAADRYLKAIKSLGKYKKHALHFLRDEKNVRSFILENPISENGEKQSYRKVYRDIQKMLDILVRCYVKENRL